MSDKAQTRWSALKHQSAAEYAARFSALAARGAAMHGEADLVATLCPSGARIVDAGCGTGRVAARLAAQGYHCVGVDADDSMIAEARRTATLPEKQSDGSVGSMDWLVGDLSDRSTWRPAQGSGVPEWLLAGTELVVAAGNVVPLVSPGTLSTVVTVMAGLLRPAGLLVAGFGLDAAHLPRGCPVTPLKDYQQSCEAAGLVPVEHLATWDREVFNPDDAGYVVCVHRLAGWSGSLRLASDPV